MSKKYYLLVLIGRFQPIHDGHISLIEKAYSMSKEVLVLIGSTGIPRDIDNPFTFTERAQMVASCFVDTEIADHLTIMSLEDTVYNNDKWIGDVQSRVTQFREMDPTRTVESIGLIGYDKDSTTWYLNAFPQWDLVEAEYHDHINATEIRRAYLRGVMKSIRMFVHPNVFAFLNEFMKTDAYSMLVDWQNFQDAHDAKWAFSPYAPTFNTADAVVTQSGHILLVKRKHAPGKGLWALPGGYISGDTYREAAIRELIEETQIKLQREVLNRAIAAERVFDHPKRSTRGRIITTAFHFKLSQMGKGLPKTKAADDAEDAKWFTFEEFRKMRGLMFEDHWDIGCSFIGY